MAHTSKTIQRFHQCFNGQGPRCKSGQGSVRLPRKPTPEAGNVQGTYSFVGGSLSCHGAEPSDLLRLTGSLALSIAYGIWADTPDNEFIRMYEEMMGTAHKALVPGSFLVDFLPLRAPDPLRLYRRRALTNDGSSQ